MKHTYTLTFLALSALVLAGCSNTAEPASEPEPTAVTDLGTAIPPSASASSSTASDIESGGPASTRTAPGHSRPVASAQGGSGTESAGTSGALTAEEQAKVDAGEYVAATDKHPAFNVPVPVMPEAAKQQTDEGAKAFVEYWVQTRNYTIQTGNTSYELSTLNQQKNNSEIKLANKYAQFYQENGWAQGCLDQTKISPDFTVKILEGIPVEVRTVPYENACKIHDLSGNVTMDLEPLDNNGKESIVYLLWSDDGWKVEELSGVSGD